MCSPLHLAFFAQHSVSGFHPWLVSILGSFSPLSSVPLYGGTRPSPVDGHLDCFLEIFLSHCQGRSDLSSWDPGAPSGALRREEGEAVGHGSGVPAILCNPDTLSAYLLYIVESPRYFLCKEVFQLLYTPLW